MNIKDIINRYYTSAAAGDWDTWLSQMDENIVMEDTLGGRLKGLADLKGKVTFLRKGYSRFYMLPVHIVIDGNEACVLWHFRGATAAGAPIDARGANYFRIDNGKIVYIADYHNPAPFEPFISQDFSKL
jgi:ketosteroid isomerase-like protein